MFAQLPDRIKEAAIEAYRLFLRNPNDPSLAHHQLKDTKKGRHKNGSWAVQITRRYRAIYVPVGKVNVWYWIGSHEDYNNFVGRI